MVSNGEIVVDIEASTVAEGFTRSESMGESPSSRVGAAGFCERENPHEKTGMITRLVL